LRRLREKNINTPEFYENMWVKDFNYDSERQKALILKVKDNDVILDIGAGVFGAGQFLKEKTDIKSEVYAIDYCSMAKETVDRMNLGIHYLCHEVTDTNFEDNFFDVVIAGELIEHMEIPQDLVREMHRVCKPDGWLVISTVNTNSLDAKKREYPEHLWEFEPSDLMTLFMPYGKTEYATVGNYHLIFCQVIKK